MKPVPVTTLLLLFACSTPAWSDAPSTFNANVEVLGSSVYNELDWYANITGSGIDVAMEIDGLRFTLNPSDDSSSRVQLKRQLKVVDGVATAAFRIVIDDVDDVGFFAGLYIKQDDPVGTEPTSAVYFTKPGDSSDPDVAKVSLRTRNGANNATDEDKFTVTAGEPFDIIVEIDGSLGTNQVKFWWRTDVTGSFGTPVTISDTSVPADGAYLRPTAIPTRSASL